MLKLWRQYFFFYTTRSIRLFLLLVLMTPTLIFFNYHYDQGESLIDTQEEIRNYSEYLQTRHNIMKSKRFDNIPDDDELKLFYRQEKANAFDLLLGDAIYQLEQAIQQNDKRKILKSNQYIYRIQQVGIEEGYSIMLNHSPKIYQMLDYSAAASLERELTIRYYDLTLESQQNEANFFIVYARMLCRFEIISILGLMIMVVSSALFISWKNFNKKRNFLYSTIPNGPISNLNHIILFNTLISATTITISYWLAILILVFRSEASLWQVMTTSFSILFNEQPFYMILIAISVMIYLSSLLVNLIFNIMTEMFNSKYIALILVVSVYVVPYVTPFYTFNRVPFYWWNPLTYLDVEMYLSEIREIYWNSESISISWMPKVYLIVFICILYILNAVVVKQKRRRE